MKNKDYFLFTLINSSMATNIHSIVPGTSTGTRLVYEQDITR